MVPPQQVNAGVPRLHSLTDHSTLGRIQIKMASARPPLRALARNAFRQPIDFVGSGGRIRTYDQLINSQLLYH
jgi:hypothetical protein